MNGNEFWCRAFLAAFRGSYGTDVAWENHGAPAAYCEKAADAALAVAQRRGMVTAGDVAKAARHERPYSEPVEFTAERQGGPASGVWRLRFEDYPDGLIVVTGDESFTLTDGNRVRVQWGSMPPKPIKVWLERKGGGA